MTTKDFARYELSRYQKMMGLTADFTIEVAPDKFDKGRFKFFDASLDDAFRISVKGNEGKIAATNERAALIGVYRYLKEMGARFYRPGKDGEYVPKNVPMREMELEIYASVRHRGVSDGNSGQNARDFDELCQYVDWLPKAMMNSFFIEMPDYFEPMRELYKAEDNPFASPKELSYEDYLSGEIRVVDEIKKRSLLFHGVGHGWTVRCMEGVPEINRKPSEKTTCDNPEILALINGKREFFNKKPLYTNLCYSSERVRKLFAEQIVKFAKEHSEYDYLHVWLADYFNNFCECKHCRKRTQSDLYVMLLNEIDKALNEAGLRQKIVFLVYFELLFPPLTERIENEERFTMMFAPYGRDFTVRYRDVIKESYKRLPLNTYSLDEMYMPKYLSELSDWQKIFGGDSFVFDYSTYDRAGDASLTDLKYAVIPHDDCLDLRRFGLNGRIECACTRQFTPTSLVLYSMGEAMLTGNSNYSEICNDYFTYSYENGEKISNLLSDLSDLLPYPYFRKKSDSVNTDDLREAIKLIDGFKNECSGTQAKDDFKKRNHELFLGYLELVRYLLDALVGKFEGDFEELILKRINELRSRAYQFEKSCKTDFSAYAFMARFSEVLSAGFTKSEF